MKITLTQLQHVLDTYDSGVLSSGSHAADDGAYCALEAVSLVRNNGRVNFTDSPSAVGMPDLRTINDAPWSSDNARTEALLPLIVALSDWSLWSATRQQKWAEIVSIRTVNRIVSALPGLPTVNVTACQKAITLTEAKYAADAATDAARYAADAARYAARSAARSAADAAADAADAADAAAYAAADAADAADAAAATDAAAYAAADAADAADAAAATDAARSAASAASVAYAAAKAAADAAANADAVLLIAVDIWLTAVKDSE